MSEEATGFANYTIVSLDTLESNIIIAAEC
jgi:hypothetical protein